MDKITIEIAPDSEGNYIYKRNYIYKLWMRDLEGAFNASDENPDEGNDNGGVCTGTLSDAVGMAQEAALEMVRHANADNIMNPALCPGGLNEYGEIAVDDAEHKWDGKSCGECGAAKD